jgi:hypothetical protein
MGTLSSSLDASTDGSVGDSCRHSVFRVYVQGLGFRVKRRLQSDSMLSMRREEAMDTHMCKHTHTCTHTQMHVRRFAFTVTRTYARFTRARPVHAHMQAYALTRMLAYHVHAPPQRLGHGRQKLPCTNVYLLRLPCTRTIKQLWALAPASCSEPTHGYVYTHTHTHTPRRPLWAWAPASSDPPTVEHRSSRVLAPAVHTHTGWHSVRPRDYRRAVKPSWARVVCTLSAPSAPALAPRRPSRSRLQF